MSLGVYDFDSSELTIANAAHLKPIHFYSGEWQKKTFGKMMNGPLVGHEGDSVSGYSNFSLKLKSGDLVFLYTDGVNEASFDEDSLQFGRRRIVRYLKEESQNEMH